MDPDPVPDPLVRGTDPGIRIRPRTKMSRIPNTEDMGGGGARRSQFKPLHPNQLFHFTDTICLYSNRWFGTNIKKEQYKENLNFLLLIHKTFLTCAGWLSAFLSMKPLNKNCSINPNSSLSVERIFNSCLNLTDFHAN